MLALASTGVEKHTIPGISGGKALEGGCFSDKTFGMLKLSPTFGYTVLLKGLQWGHEGGTSGWIHL